MDFSLSKQLASDVLALCRERGLMIATAESCTGGLISASLTSVPGSSDVFDRGFATYSNDAKVEMLGVPMEEIAAHGAVSEQVAAHMARGAVARSAAQIGVSVTGVAGPGGTQAKPEGMVCFGVATAQWRHTETVQFGAIGRDSVRLETVNHALSLVLKSTDAF